MHKIELLLVCVNRSSFLKETLPCNKHKFDNVVVVTTPSDYETQHICREEGVQCVHTDVFYEDGAPFDKGRAINFGLNNLKYNEWVVLTDADIVFLNQHQKLFRDESLKKELLYGSDRIIIEDKSSYNKFVSDLALNPQNINLDSLRSKDGKQLAVGFFQMFYLGSDMIEKIKSFRSIFSQEEFDQIVLPSVGDPNYPREGKVEGEIYPRFPTAGGCDSQFRFFYSREQKIAVVAIPVVHLGKDGIDHSGKKSIIFH